MNKPKKFYNDAETTGTDPKLHGLIQFAAILNVDGEDVESFDIKIQPFATDVIEEDALKVNGITREELFTDDRMKPYEAHIYIEKTLAKHIDKFDRQDKAMLIGYRAGFDADFMREFFRKNGDTFFGSWFWTPPLDVMGLAGYVLQKERHLIPDFKLKTVWEYLHQNQKGLTEFTEEDWHDALFDIERTRDIEFAIRKRLFPHATSR